ncbi:hypothetical protein [Peribacillus simplex]|uniref:hypothetical protein n=1 Tax=Peribacillus simplex TaxID=1478 RepID=UPI003D2D0C1E
MRAIVQEGLTIEDIVGHLEIRGMLEGEAAARANLKGKEFEGIKLHIGRSIDDLIKHHKEIDSDGKTT